MYFFGSWVVDLAGGQNSTEIPCFEIPVLSPQSSNLALCAQNLARAALYDNLEAYRRTTDAVTNAAHSISLTAEAHVSIRRDLMGHLDEIQRLLERAKQDLEVTPDGPSPMSYAFVRTDAEARSATIDLQLSKAEYEIGSILSSYRDAKQEREREAITKVEVQVSAALDSLHDFVSTFTWDRKDYGISPTQILLRRWTQITYIRWPLSWWLADVNDWIKRFGPSGDSAYRQWDLESQMQNHAAIAHSRVAQRVFQEFLSSLEAWKALDTQMRNRWDAIDSRMHIYMRDTSPTKLQDAVQQVLSLVQDFGESLDEELQAFMVTWGRAAGYVWAEVAPATPGARACRARDIEFTRL
ncbi:hypothetical protein F5883DRAFT_676701 [Diaporthe sp. PMI_573]|nr:hypothetical protein F5883DRAFT_676701 [Diaporthaceae sp. PMI_573]